MAHDHSWSADVDRATVERLIAAIQQAVVEAVADWVNEAGWIEMPAPELSMALLSLLAATAEQAPQCGTPMGMRRTAEAMGKELLQLMRDVRRLREADQRVGSTSH